MLVTALVRCDACRLLFRVPTDPRHFGKRFYQQEYHSELTTDCPQAQALKDFIATG